MSLRRSALVLMSQAMFAGLVVGCHAPPPPAAPPPPPPATEDEVSNVQAELLQQDPNARTGLVTLVRPADRLVAVTLSAPGEGKSDNKIKVGDTFTFVDSRQNPLANGQVVSIDGDLMVLSYLEAAGGKAPREGDIAVHLSSK